MSDISFTLEEFKKRHTSGELTRIVGSYPTFTPNWNEYHAYCFRSNYPIYDFQKYIKQNIGRKVSRLTLFAYANNFLKLFHEAGKIYSKATQDVAKREAQMKRAYWRELLHVLKKALLDLKDKGDEEPVDLVFLMDYRVRYERKPRKLE